MIKEGYQLSIRSWENDGDNYNTVVNHGLTEDDVKFLVKILSPFGRGGKHGNDVLDFDWFKEHAKEAITEHISSGYAASLALAIQSDDYEINCWLNEFLGNPSEGYDGDFVRVNDSMTVHYIPQAIKDVTDQFVSQ